MEKDLICIAGTMGVGKTTTCRALQGMLPGCVFLDGDWCWDARPFLVNEETQALVIRNIAFLLRGFVDCTAYKTVLFCWVLHERDILEQILRAMGPGGYRLHVLSLICAPEALEKRLGADVQAGLRAPEVLPRSLERLPAYAALGWPLLDTTELSPREAAKLIYQGLAEGKL